MLPQTDQPDEIFLDVRRLPRLGDRILVPQPNGKSRLRNLVSRKLFQRRCHVIDGRGTVPRADRPVGMAGDVV
jgi:hypothetical protein